jgi:hypothetical protein
MRNVYEEFCKIIRHLMSTLLGLWQRSAVRSRQAPEDVQALAVCESSRNTKTAPDKSGAFKLFPATWTSSIHNDQAPPLSGNNPKVTTTRWGWRYGMHGMVQQEAAVM